MNSLEHSRGVAIAAEDAITGDADFENSVEQSRVVAIATGVASMAFVKNATAHSGQCQAYFRFILIWNCEAPPHDDFGCDKTDAPALPGNGLFLKGRAFLRVSLACFVFLRQTLRSFSDEA